MVIVAATIDRDRSKFSVFLWILDFSLKLAFDFRNFGNSFKFKILERLRGYASFWDWANTSNSVSKNLVIFKIQIR